MSQGNQIEDIKTILEAHFPGAYPGIAAVSIARLLSENESHEDGPVVLSVRAGQLPEVSRDPWDREGAWWTPSGKYIPSDGDCTNPCVKEIRARSSALLKGAAELEALALAIEAENASVDPAEKAWREYLGSISGTDLIDLPGAQKAFLHAFRAGTEARE